MEEPSRNPYPQHYPVDSEHSAATEEKQQNRECTKVSVCPRIVVSGLYQGDRCHSHSVTAAPISTLNVRQTTPDLNNTTRIPSYHPTPAKGAVWRQLHQVLRCWYCNHLAGASPFPRYAGALNDHMRHVFRHSSTTPPDHHLYHYQRTPDQDIPRDSHMWTQLILYYPEYRLPPAPAPTTST